MTAIGDFNVYTSLKREIPRPMATETYRVEQSNWGYTVRNLSAPDLAITLMQGLCWLLGMAFIVAILGLWIMPAAVFSGPAFGLKVGASAMLFAVAYYSMWYASRGTQVEVQIDTRAREVREIVRNRAGRPRQLARYAFTDIGSVFVDFSGVRSRKDHTQGTLVMRYRTSAQTIVIAAGTLEQLVPLRDMLGRDVMLGGRQPVARPLQSFPQVADQSPVTEMQMGELMSKTIASAA